MSLIRLALACTVRGIDFVRRRENQKRLAIKVHVEILFDLLLGFSNCDLPTARAGNLIEGFLNHRLHSVLFDVQHVCFLSLADFQLMRGYYSTR